jgi:hypothetical protein
MAAARTAKTSAQASLAGADGKLALAVMDIVRRQGFSAELRRKLLALCGQAIARLGRIDRERGKSNPVPRLVSWLIP